MSDFFDKTLAERRSLEQMLSDLRTRYERRPGPELAEKIQNLEAEISHRKATGRDQSDSVGM